ncbi:MAG TPA: DUF2069 domain-containing protein, partial [Candidatus Kapabacteria bacterium]|nr:DUF2069 domain-containing protein [Candidatus Kapabacteria bacterium]
MTTSRASRARKLTLVLLISLLVFMAAETFLFAPPTMSLAAILFIIGIKIVPPALFILPLSRGHAMSAVWLGILLMPYFCWAVLGALVPGTEGVVAAMRGALTAACVVSAMLFARWQKA